MQNQQGEFRALKDREVDLIHKMADRGHEIAELYERAIESDEVGVIVKYSQVGNFTIASIARERTGIRTVADMAISGMVTGASKRHPDDDPDELVGKNIAFSRALKGGYVDHPEYDMEYVEENAKDDLKW